MLIVSDPAIMMAKPVIAGTRITVDLIVEKLESGETIDQILEAHPRLNCDSILAALDFANRVLSSDLVYPILMQADWFFTEHHPLEGGGQFETILFRRSQ